MSVETDSKIGALQGLNKEIKRPSDVVGIYDRAVTRLVGALMLEQNDEWAVCGRDMSLERVAAITDPMIGKAIEEAIAPT